MDILGDFAAGVTIDHMWETLSAGSGSITRATNGSIRIYKNNSTTQRSSAAGITDTEDFDSMTGIHHLRIDLADNTDAGFYAAGNTYFVMVQAMTLEGLNINALLASFNIVATTLGTLNTAIADIPTNAELATSQAAADDATLAAIAALSIPAAAAIATAVWTEELPGSYDPGAAGAILGSIVVDDLNAIQTAVGNLSDDIANTAQSVWDMALPGAFGAGSAGELVGNMSAAAISDAVWDEAIAGHLAAGSTGLALNAAGGAGDPWSTAIPGAYGAGTAGKILGDNINATISSRASQTTLDTLDNFVDTEVADIQARLPAALSAGGFMKADVQTVLASASAPNHLNRQSFGVFQGTADSGTATTMVDAGLTQATDVLAGSLLLFCGGTNRYASRLISSFNPATDTVTWVEPLPSAVTTEDYIILPFSLASLAAAINTLDNFVDNEIGEIQTTLDNLPTNAELATALGTSDDAILTILGTPINGSIALDVAAGGGGGASLDAAAVRAAVGLAEANLDTQLTGPRDANVTKVNGIAVTGLGTRAFPWGPT